MIKKLPPGSVTATVSMWWTFSSFTKLQVYEWASRGGSLTAQISAGSLHALYNQMLPLKSIQSTLLIQNSDFIEYYNNVISVDGFCVY